MSIADTGTCPDVTLRLALERGVDENRDDVVELTFEIAERAVAKIRGS